MIFANEKVVERTMKFLTVRAPGIIGSFHMLCYDTKCTISREVSYELSSNGLQKSFTFTPFRHFDDTDSNWYVTALSLLVDLVQICLSVLYSKSSLVQGSLFPQPHVDGRIG